MDALVRPTEHNNGFQMVELHIGRLLPPDATNAHAILLLFDDESPATLKRIIEYTFDPDLGQRLKNSMHALRYLECSAKQMNGVKYVFLETLAALKLKPEKETEDPEFMSLTPMEGVACSFESNWKLWSTAKPSYDKRSGVPDESGCLSSRI
ncbi:hypothetical protein OSTOST_08900, partial [Ostertagia ostertagi]